MKPKFLPLLIFNGFPLSIVFQKGKIVSNQIFFQLREKWTDKFARVATKGRVVENEKCSYTH